MTIFNRPLRALEAGAAHWWRRLDSPAAAAWARWLVPLGFGLLSLWLGQDENWDLRNYHRYNPYALLNGKIGLDLAPGQWQSYFNPTLDLLYHGLNALLPAPAVGFVMGWLHGLNFVLLQSVAQMLLRQSGAERAAWRLPLLLALAGCCGVGYLSELGNTMGDNMTSLCVLGALCLLLRQWPRLAGGGVRALTVAALAGLIMGVGTGLKLTNATYALALCLALFALPGSLALSLRNAFVFGLGVLAGIGVSAGYWFLKMWHVFGNPLFPQFNDRFHGPLAAAIGIGDTGWQPQGWREKLFWPFIFTLNPKRVIELPITQIIWPLVYVAFVALIVLVVRAAALAPTAPAPQRAGMPAPAKLLLWFFALAYAGWLNLFGIYRYLVPIELLAPLVFWLLLERLLAPPVARVVAGAGLTLAMLAVFPFPTWGHAGWRQAAFTADVPHFDYPDQSLVLTVHGDPPMGWMVPFFPSTLPFVALGSGFPESPAYLDRLNGMMAGRRGPLYVMLQAAPGDPANRTPEQIGREQEQDRGFVAQAQTVLGRYGIEADTASCVTRAAFIGQNPRPYQMCVVHRR